MKRGRCGDGITGDADMCGPPASVVRLPTSTLLYFRRSKLPPDVPLTMQREHVFGDEPAMMWTNVDDVPPASSVAGESSIYEFKLFGKQGLRLIQTDDTSSQDLDDGQVDGFMSQDGTRVFVLRPYHVGLQLIDDDKVKGRQQTLITDLILKRQITSS